MNKKNIPIIIILSAILILTLQSPAGSQGVSSFVQSIVLRIVDMPWIHNMKLFRTVLHAPLYLLLGLALAILEKKFWKSIGIGFLIALADETLKIFLPTREFGALDLAFDAVGLIIGVGLVWLVRKLSKDLENDDGKIEKPMVEICEKYGIMKGGDIMQTVKSQRIQYTPSTLARSSLLHLSETGSLTALQPHTSARENLGGYLLLVVEAGWKRGGDYERTIYKQ